MLFFKKQLGDIVVHKAQLIFYNCLVEPITVVTLGMCYRWQGQ